MAIERVRRQRAAARKEDMHTVHETVLEVMSSAYHVEEHKRKVLHVRKFETDPAFVCISAGVTKSLGQYEFLRVDCSISMPCYAEEVDEVQAVVATQVAQVLDAEVDAYLAGEGNGAA